MSYDFKQKGLADGTVVMEVRGPGMPQHANSVRVATDHDARMLASFIALAFEHGKKAKADELRRVLGIYQRD